MRINVYSQEITSIIDRVTKHGTDKDGKPAQFHGIRLYLHSASQLHHTPEDDDRSAVTIWLPRSLGRRVDLAITLRVLAAWAEGSWPGGWVGWQDGPDALAVKADREHAAEDRAETWGELAEMRRELAARTLDAPRCRGCASTSCPGIEGGLDACPRWQEAEARNARGEYLTTRPLPPADRIAVADALSREADARPASERAAAVGLDREAQAQARWAAAGGDLRGYPAPHYDEDDTCPCPDHEAQRAARRADLGQADPVRAWVERPPGSKSVN